MITIDGSYGEGGGQIIRTAVTLACITEQDIEIKNIRANRDKSGLRNQHLTCVQAAAELCAARLEGAEVGSEHLIFRPTRGTQAGYYFWDVKTAGAASLVMQTILLPLALATGESRVIVKGGTHVPHSPTAHYLRDVYVPMLVQCGADAHVQINQMGWYPQGGGEIEAFIAGDAKLTAQDFCHRGELERIFGVALATNLPAHVPQRLTNRAQKRLKPLDVPLDIRPTLTKGRSTGAAINLLAEYENGRAGFSILGAKGTSSETVADSAVDALLEFHSAEGSVDPYLADQILPILAISTGKSCYITSDVTLHLTTNAWVIQQFIERSIKINQLTGRIDL